MRSPYIYATLLAAQAISASLAQTLQIEAESGVISAPFVATNGYISQPFQTSLTNGGRAVYDFVVTNTGKYVILATVNATDTHSNSFFVKIDGEPRDSDSVWEFPASAGFTEQKVTLLGSSPQFGHVWTLSEGRHQLVIRGNGANARLDRLAIARLPEPPAPPKNLRIVAGP